MEGHKLRDNLLVLLLAAALCALAILAFGQTPTPTPPIQPIVNGRVYGDLDMNNYRLLNWDYSNWPLGGGGGGGAGLPSQPGHAGQFLQTDGTNPLWATVSFASLSGKPTTIAGYGILDGFALANNFSELANTALGGNAATARTNLGLQIGLNVEAWSLNLDTWSGKTPYGGSLSISPGKTVSFANSLSFNGNDGASLVIGAGGTLGTAAFTNSTAYDPAGAAATKQPLNADLTALSGLTGTNTIYYRSGASTWSAVNVSTGLSFSGGNLTATGGAGGGTITSPPTPPAVYAANMLSVFTDTTGTIIGSTNSFNGVPFLTAGVLSTSAQLAATAGGTGVGAVALGDILYGSATNNWARLSANSAANNKYLRSFNLGAPSWQQIPFSDLVSTPTTLSGYGITDGLKTTNNLSDVTTPATARTNLGLTIGTNVEAWDADLDAIAAIGVTASGTQTAIPYRSGTNTWGTVTLGSGLTFSSGTLAATTTGGDTISDVTSSVDGQAVVFSGTTGKHIKPTTVTNTIPQLNASGVLGSTIPHYHYAVDLSNTISSLGTPSAPASWPTGTIGGATLAVTVATEPTPSPMTSSDGYIRLPTANSFGSGSIITYQDYTTLGNFGRNFQAFNNGTDKLDGIASGSNFPSSGTPWFRPFIAGGATGSGTYQFQSDGIFSWRSVYAAARASAVISPNDASKVATFNVENFVGSTNNTVSFYGGGASATVQDYPITTTPGQFIVGFHSDPVGDPADIGKLIPGYVHPTDLAYHQFDIPNSAIGNCPGSPANTVCVPNDGTYDSIRLSATLSAPLTVVLPVAGLYGSAEPLTFFDASGQISSAFPVTLVSNAGSAPVSPCSGDTFNGQCSVSLNAPFSVLTLRSNGSLTAGNWSYPIPGSTSPTVPIAHFNDSANMLGDASLITQSCDQTVLSQHWSLLSAAGRTTRTIRIQNARDGETGIIAFTHNSSGGDTVVIENAATPGNGQGVLNLSTAPNAVDDIYWVKVGTQIHAYAVLDFSPPTVISGCSIAGATAYGGTSASSSVGNNTGRTYVVQRFTASTAASTAGGFCRVDAGIWKDSGVIGTINVTQVIYAADGAGGIPGTFVAQSNPVQASAITALSLADTATMKTTFSYGSTVNLTNGTNYYMGYSVDTINSTKYFHVAMGTGTIPVYTNSNPTTTPWAGPVNSGQFTFQVYHQ
jgi:hypothetical protein